MRVATIFLFYGFYVLGRWAERAYVAEYPEQQGLASAARWLFYVATIAATLFIIARLGKTDDE